MHLPWNLRALTTQLVRELRGRPAFTPLWDGVYPSFAAAPTSGPSFRGDVWLDKMEATTREIRALGARAPIELARGEYALLPLWVSREPSSKLCVLDFGGGLGRDFLTLRAICPTIELDYHIVEMESLCQRGRDLHVGEPMLTFHARIPSLVPDLVVCHSSLQFVDDWKGKLAELASSGARSFAMIHVPAGEITAFATVQNNVAGSGIPCWFFSREQLVAEMTKLGYTLSYQSLLERTYDMSNFRPDQRVQHPCNLFFKKAA